MSRGAIPFKFCGQSWAEPPQRVAWMIGVAAKQISQIESAYAGPRRQDAPVCRRAVGPSVSTGGWRPQDLSRPRFIPLHLRDERGGRSEFLLRPDPGDEENLDRFAIKIAGKIE